MKTQNRSYIFIDRKNLSLEINVSYKTWSRAGWYFANCPELQLIDQGKSKGESIENLSEMIIASLEEAIESNHIKEMLRELGFSRRTLTAPKKEYYELPVTLNKNMNMLYLMVPLSKVTIDKPASERVSR